MTHDRYFLDNVAQWILELDRGEGHPFKGNYSSWLEQKKSRLERDEKTESARQKALQRELEWVRKSPQARRAKSKARIAAYEQLLNQDPRKRETEVEIKAKAEGSEFEFDNDAWQFGIDSWRNVGYGYWQRSCLVTMI